MSDPDLLQCRRCQTVIDSSAAVWLWDARFYCAGCVEQACPGLVRFARGHAVLQERAPYTRLQLFVRYILLAILLCVLGLGLVPAIWIVAAGGTARHLNSYLVGFCFYVIPLAAVVGAAFGAAASWSFSRYRPTLEVSDGELRLTYGCMTVYASPYECRWCLGRGFHMSSKGPLFLPFFHRVVLVALPKPRDVKGIWSPVAVGFTPQMRSIWQAFLQLAGSPYSTTAKWKLVERNGLD